MKTEKEQADESVKMLKEELRQINAKLAEVPALEKRKQELAGGWNRTGQIKLAEYHARDIAFPVWPSSGYQTTRIVGVDEKWVCLRGDKSETVTRYSRETSRRERTRSDYDNIDIAKAIRIWNEWQKPTQEKGGAE